MGSALMPSGLFISTHRKRLCRQSTRAVSPLSYQRPWHTVFPEFPLGLQWESLSSHVMQYYSYHSLAITWNCFVVVKLLSS